MEYWVLEAKVKCHDTLWANAEKGDQRALEKHDAEKLMVKNPGNFQVIEILANYGGKEWQRKSIGSRTQSNVPEH
jgi:hypothetical protein